jgi:phage shock protein A
MSLDRDDKARFERVEKRLDEMDATTKAILERMPKEQGKGKGLKKHMAPVAQVIGAVSGLVAIGAFLLEFFGGIL